MADIIIKKSKIGQFDKGVFANRDIKKGEEITTDATKDDIS